MGVCVCVPFVGAQQSHTDPSIDPRGIIGCIAPVGTQRLQHRHQIGASLRLGMLAFRYSVVSPTYPLSAAARQLTLGCDLLDARVSIVHMLAFAHA